MLIRVESQQTNNEFWINPSHVISIRVDHTSRTATIKLSDGSTHTVKTGTGATTLTSDLGKLLAESQGTGAMGRSMRLEGRRDLERSDIREQAAHPTRSASGPAVLDAKGLLTTLNTRLAG